MGKVYGRWHGACPCDNDQNSAMWTNGFRAYEGKSSELMPPGQRSGESVQFNWIGKVLLNAETVAYLVFGGRKALVYLIVWDSSGRQWKTLQQEEECDRSARTESIFQVGATPEVETERAGSWSRNQGDDRGR